MSGELAIVSLGKAIATYIFKCWIGHGNLVEELGVEAISAIAEKYRSTSTYDALPTEPLSPLNTRRASRLIDEISDEISKRFNTYLKTETHIRNDIVRNSNGYYTIINKHKNWVAELEQRVEGERNAVLIALATSLRRSQIDINLVFDSNLEPVAIEAHINTKSPRAADDLCDAAKQLYSRLLREACNYIVEVYITLPKFTSLAAKEILQREQKIIELLTTVLDRLSEPTASFSKRAHNDDFLKEYLRSLRRKLDWMELIGVELSPLTKRYQLSTSYVRLAALDHSKDDANVKLANTDNNAEAILSRGDRHLVLGQAGTGKTTLLQWLAVCATKSELPDPLHAWNNRVPFLIRLRQVQDSFPSPQNWIALLLPDLSALASEKWVHGHLSQGALVLIDGVDEVSVANRGKFDQWIRDLVEHFPSSAFVITSRPLVSHASWINELKFKVCELRPMGLVSIKLFVEKWFDTMVIGATDHEHVQQLKALRPSFSKILAENPHYRDLSQYPLLAAMLCGLHVDRKGYLPANRMEIYRIALDMLLGRRDEERDIYTDQRPPLRHEEMKEYLQDIAYWFLQNSQSEAAIGDVQRCIESTRKVLPKTSLPAANVLQFLIERTGLLREPAKGMIDFVHKTFQEYLAAKVCIQANLIPFLINNAHVDHMREIFILSVGHATPGQAKRLINGILSRANSDTEFGKTLRILAVSCNETLIRLVPSVYKNIHECVAQVLPPTNILEAMEIGKVIGNRAAILSGFEAREASIVAACVCGLGVSQSIEAIPVIRSYARDARLPVMAEVFRSWEYFDRNEYAREVISRCAFVGEVLWRRDIVQYEHENGGFNGQIYVDSEFTLESLCHLTGIRGLTITDVDQLRDLSALDNLHCLKEIEIIGCTNITDVGPLSKHDTLSKIVLQQCGIVADLELVVEKAMEMKRGLYIYIGESSIAQRLRAMCGEFGQVTIVSPDYSTS